MNDPSIKKRIAQILVDQGTQAYGLKAAGKQWRGDGVVKWIHPVTKQRIRSYSKEAFKNKVAVTNFDTYADSHAPKETDTTTLKKDLEDSRKLATKFSADERGE